MLRVDPENVGALYYQSLVFIALDRPSDAQGALEKARGLRPEDLDVAFQLGVLFFSLKQYEKAEPPFRQVYQSEPNRPNLGYYLGFMEYRKKKYREALTFLRTNVPSDDNFAQLTRFYTGLAMGGLGMAGQALVEIEQALRLQPVSPLTGPAERFGEVLRKAREEERFFTGELRLGYFFDNNVPVTPRGSSDATVKVLRGGRRKSKGQLVALDLSYIWLKKPESGWEGTVSHTGLGSFMTITFR